MRLIHAQDMVPGGTYVGTADGPMVLDGVHFTPLTIVAYTPETFGVPSDDDLWLLQVQYDAWATPLPEVTGFAPFDVVYEFST